MPSKIGRFLQGCWDKVDTNKILTRLLEKEGWTGVEGLLSKKQDLPRTDFDLDRIDSIAAILFLEILLV